MLNSNVECYKLPNGDYIDPKEIREMKMLKETGRDGIQWTVLLRYEKAFSRVFLKNEEEAQILMDELASLKNEVRYTHIVCHQFSEGLEKLLEGLLRKVPEKEATSNNKA